jgi:hypothetical protein
MQLIDRNLVFANNKFTRISSYDALVQQITNQVTIWKNEWFADRTIGIDYINFENRKFSDKEIISSVTQSLYLNKNISLVNSIIVSRNKVSRKITLDINIETVEGNMVIII